MQLYMLYLGYHGSECGVRLESDFSARCQEKCKQKMIDHTCGGENDSDQDQSRNDNGNQIDEEIRLPRRVSSAPGLQRPQGLTMDNGDAPSHKSVEDQV